MKAALGTGAGEHDLAGILAEGGSEASESEEPPPSEAAGAKGNQGDPTTASPGSRRRAAARRREQELRERKDTSGIPCSLCHKPGHIAGHCPTMEAQRQENDRRVLEQRAAAARATDDKAAAEKKASPPATVTARSLERERPRSRERERERPCSRERERERERDKPSGGRASETREPEKGAGGRASARRSRERSGSHNRKEKRRRSRSRSRSPVRAAADAPRRASQPAAAPAPTRPAEDKPVEDKPVEDKHGLRDTRESFDSVLAEAKRLKHAADAVKTHEAPKAMLRAVLQYVEAAMMQQSQVSGNPAAGEQLAMLLTQTSALCEFAGARAEELLRDKQSDSVAVQLRLVRLLALRLCICCVAQAAAFRRGALRVEAEAAAESAEGGGANAAVQKRLAVALLDSIRLSDLWESAGAAAIVATSSCQVSRACTEALSSCMTVASAAGGYGELRQVRVHAKHAMNLLDRLT